MVMVVVVMVVRVVMMVMVVVILVMVTVLRMRVMSWEDGDTIARPSGHISLCLMGAAA